MISRTAFCAPGDLYISTGLRELGQKNEILRLDATGALNIVVAGGNFYGLAFDRAGNLYAATGQGGSVTKYGTDGSRGIFASGMGLALGLTFDGTGNLFVASGKQNSIWKITPDGAASVFMSGLNEPTALVFDASGNLFFSERTSGNVVRLTLNGQKSVFASGMNEPQALVFDRAGDLFAIEGAGPNIFRIKPDGTRTLFAQVGVRGLGLVFDRNGHLVATDNAGGYLYIFDSTGEVIDVRDNVQSPIHLAVEPGASVSSGRPSNLSTRGRVDSGDNVLIGGFIAGGTAPKKLLVRAIGPSLATFGVSEFLPNPRLDLFDANGNHVGANDNWKINESSQQSQQSEIEATTHAPSNDLEAALITTLPAQQGYTAIVRGVGATSGVSLVEAYDLEPSATDASLANVSTRGLVGSGANVMIGGFILNETNGGATSVVVRAVGPSLAQFGITNPLTDPILDVFDAQGMRLAGNDDWKINSATGQTQEADVRASGHAPADDHEAAVLLTLSPGAYTAIVSSKTGTPGIALFELYTR